MYEHSEARRDDKMSRRPARPIKPAEDGPLWPTSQGKKVMKKVANARRRRRDKRARDEDT